MESRNIIDLYNKKETVFFKIMLWIISAVIVFVPINYMNETGKILNGIFFAGLVHRDFYSLFEITLIFTFIMLTIKFRLSPSKLTVFGKYVLYGGILCFVLKISNPNNTSSNPIMGLSLLSDISNYSYIFILYIILSLDSKIQAIFIGRLFRKITTLMVIRAIFLLFIWVLGMGNKRFFGINSTLVEMGTLILAAFVQNVIFALYLSKRQKKLVLLWFILLLIQLLSFRRTGLYISIGSNVMVYIVYFSFSMKYKGVYSKIIMSSFVFTLVFVLPILFGALLQGPTDIYVDRYLGIFPSIHTSNERYGNDGGHWEQSLITTQEAMKKGFWGDGYGKRTEIKGAYKGYLIHNTWASLWARHGLYLVIYYIIIFIVLQYDVIRIVLFSKRNELPYIMMRAALTSFLIMYFIGLTFVTAPFLEYSKMSFILTLTLSGFIKIKPDNYRYLFA